jgi:parallel beta-helix repeat protein
MSSKVGLVIPNNDNVVFQGPGDISNIQGGISVKSANHVNLSSLILEQSKRGAYIQNSNYLHIEQNVIKDNDVGIVSSK